MRRFLPLAIAITLFVALIGTAAFFWNDGWNNHRNGTEIVQVVPAGTDATTGNTVVVLRDNHRPFFFPGFLFIPFFFFIVFCIVRPFWGSAAGAVGTELSTELKSTRLVRSMASGCAYFPARDK